MASRHRKRKTRQKKMLSVPTSGAAGMDARGRKKPSCELEHNAPVNDERVICQEAGNVAKRRFIRGWRGVLLGLGLVTGLWVVLVTALPPTVLRGMLETQISEALNAPVLLDNVTVNPFTFAITMQGIRVPYPDSADMPTERVPVESGTSAAEMGALLTIESVKIVPDPGSLFRSGPIQASVRLERPVLDIEHLGNGVFSFSRLFPTSAEAVEEPREEGRRADMFALSDLQVFDGLIVLRDRLLGRTNTISDIRLSVPFRAERGSVYPTGKTGIGENGTEKTSVLTIDSDIPDDVPTLSGQVNGSPFVVRGELQSESEGLHATFRLKTTAFAMEDFRHYLESFTPIRLNRGTVELDLALTLTEPKQGTIELALSGLIRLADVELLSPERVVIGRLGRGEIRLDTFTLNRRLAQLGAVELDRLFLRVSRDAKGRVDWEEWFRNVPETPQNVGKSAPSVQTASQEVSLSQEQVVTPFVIEGADLVLRNSDFIWADATFADSRKIEITGVDGRIAEYSTRPGAKTAMRLSFGINTEGVLALEGEGTLNPPSMDATLMVEDLPLVVLRPLLGSTPLKDVLGRIDLKGHFRMDDVAPGVRVSIDGGNAAVRAFSFGRGNSVPAASVKEGNPAVRVASFQFKGLELDTHKRTLSLKTLGVVSPYLRLRETVAGLELGIPGAAISKPSTTSVRTNDARLLGLQQTLVNLLDGGKVSVGAFRLDKGKLEREQATKSKVKAADVLVSDLYLETGAVSSDLAKAISFKMRSRGVRSDDLELAGTLRLLPLDVSFTLAARDVGLDSLALLVRSVTDVSPEGRLRADMDIGVKEAGKQLHIRTSGDLTLRDALFRDVRTGERFGSLRRLTLNGMRFSSSDRMFAAGDVLLDRPHLELVRDDKGELELLQILHKRRPQTTVSTPELPFSHFSVGSIRIQDGRLLFRDQSVNPPASTNVRSLEVAVGAFSSTSPAASPTGSGLAEVTLSAQLDGAPLKLSGQANPSSKPPVANLLFSVTGLELVRYSGYARRYLGYPVKQGRLTLETRFTTRNGDFSAENNIRMSKLELGPRDTASNAPEYPLTLGLALLEDMSGTVSVKVPVQGKWNDSTLHVGGLVGSALGGLVTKILTSPFSLVGGLFSFMTDNPELYAVAFGAGQSRLRSASRESFGKLATFLRQHPKLRLGLVGMWEKDSDTQGLKRLKVYRQVKALKHAGLPRAQREKTSADAVTFAAGEYETFLYQAYSTAPVAGKKRDRAGVVIREEPDVMERKLQALVEIPESALQTLAQERAEAVRASLLTIDPKLAPRVHLMEKNGAPLVRSGATQVELQLR